jgi:hypothetical protein
MAAAAAPRIPLLPARAFMQPYRTVLTGDQPFVFGGSPVTFKLRQQGYLDELIVWLTGSYTVANAALVAIQMGYYRIVRNFLYKPPNKPASAFDLDGAFAHVWNLVQRDFNPARQQFRFPAQGVLDAAPYWATLVDQFPSALGAQAASLWWVLPTHLAVDDIRGTVPLGNLQQQSLIVSPAVASDFLDVPANLTSPSWTIEVEQVFLAPPPAGALQFIRPTTIAPDANGVDTDWLIAYSEQEQPIVATGPQLIEITPEYTILGILHALSVATTGTGAQLDMADISGIQLTFNTQGIFPDGPIDPRLFLFHQTYQQTAPLPNGFWFWDFNNLGRWDWINTDPLTELKAELDIKSGTVMGANPRARTSVKRLLDLNPGAHLAAAAL